ncbi:MAG: hypothetical protein ACO1RA_22335 [Planctomycetaceae bacterium]
MASISPQISIPDSLQGLIAALRRRIRIYLVADGIAQLLIWLVLTFWAVLAVDYLPVLAGSDEMPVLARMIALAVVVVGGGWLVQRTIVSRLMVPLADRSMALLLERQFAGFGDSLVTTIELAGKRELPPNVRPEMLVTAVQRAERSLGGVRLGKVFHQGRLAGKIVLASLLVATLVATGYASPAFLKQGVQRIYGLSQTPWPRSSLLEVQGVEVISLSETGEEVRQVVPFVDGKLKVAKGARLVLRVTAFGESRGLMLPTKCLLHYVSDPLADGGGRERGTATLSNYRDRDGDRQFIFDGQPLAGLLSSLTFDVVGRDYRLRDLRIEVVDSPAVVSTTLDLKYPDYLVDEATSNFLPVAGQPYVPSGTFVPLGTEVKLHFQSSKPLRKAWVTYVKDSQKIAAGSTTDAGSAVAVNEEVTELVPAGVDSDRLSFVIPKLAGDMALQVKLEDVDGVPSAKPLRVFLTGVEDRPPQIEVRLKGIGTSVTPDVNLPLEGKITDDYGTAAAWLDLEQGEGNLREVKLSLGTRGEVAANLDFRELRQAGTQELHAGETLLLTVKASDKHNLDGITHVGTNDRVQLAVVTPEELLKQLELRELGLRRRFEVTLEEMNQLRDSLVRVSASLTEAEATKVAPSESGEDAALTPEQLAERAMELRLLRVQRAIQQSQKSSQEVRGVSDGFGEICEELINNRVDTEDKRQRLKDQISVPLAAIVEKRFAALDQQLAALEQALRENPPKDAAEREKRRAEAAAVLETSVQTIAELEAVLQKMLDLETFNEVLDLVRGLLDDQRALNDRTQKERKRQAVEDLK